MPSRTSFTVLRETSLCNFKASELITIAGFNEKYQWLRKIGADYALYVPSSSFPNALVEAAKPSYADCSNLDNVGGPVLSVCFSAIKRNGCIAAWSVSGYDNDPSQMVLSNWAEVIINRLTVKGIKKSSSKSSMITIDRA
ncbi:hypothetical protein EV361DRAFT_887467 [Lentinula raphanica]|nr:hypothetical protein EV361DRAFT_887467 [Lentinula raphanica]